MTKEFWIKKCQGWKNKWPVFQPDYENKKDGINIYKFIECLNHSLKESATVVSDAGSSLYACAQGLKLKDTQRWICSWAQSQMGAAISMSCGVCFAKNKEETIVIVGDGSFHTQVNALATIKYFNLPIKIFILQNNGYLSIKNTQDKFYEGRRIGTDSNDGIFFPKIEDISKAYQIKYLKIAAEDNIDERIQEILSLNCPIICEIICPELQEIIPCMMIKKDKFGNSLQPDISDMYPYLTDEDYNAEMIKN